MNGRGHGFTGAALLTLGLLLSACAGPGSPAAPASGTAAGEPAVQRLVFSVPPVAGEESNDMRHLSASAMWPLRPMYEYLTLVDPKTGKIAPGLATSWNIEPDGKSVRFILRRGIQYHHDHGEFSAQDVIFAWQEAIRPDSLTPAAEQIRQSLKDIEKVHDHEIIFRMHRPNANLFREWGEAEGSGTPIRSKLHADRMAGPPTLQTGPLAGTGPYQLRQRTPGGLVYQQLRWRHWRQTPEFPEFEFRFTREPSTRLAQLLAGEAHLASLPAEQAEQAEQAGLRRLHSATPSLRLMLGAGRCCTLVDPKDPARGYRHPDSPLLDLRVRRALNKAIPRQGLHQSIFAGRGGRLLVGHFDPTRPGWNPLWERDFEQEYGYDPARARALLAEAGYSAVRPLSVTLPAAPAAALPGGQALLEGVVNAWRAAGINVNVLAAGAAERAAGPRHDQPASPLQLLALTGGQLQGVTTSNTGLQTPPEDPEDPEVDAWVAELWVTLDQRKHEALWRKVGDALFYRHLQFPLFWLPAEAVINPRVVAGWDWPGSLPGVWSHVEYIRATRG